MKGHDPFSLNDFPYGKILTHRSTRALPQSSTQTLKICNAAPHRLFNPTRQPVNPSAACDAPRRAVARATRHAPRTHQLHSPHSLPF